MSRRIMIDGSYKELVSVNWTYAEVMHTVGKVKLTLYKDGDITLSRMYIDDEPYGCSSCEVIAMWCCNCEKIAVNEWVTDCCDDYDIINKKIKLCKACEDKKYNYYLNKFFDDADELYVKGKLTAYIRRLGSDLFLKSVRGEIKEEVIDTMLDWYTEKKYNNEPLNRTLPETVPAVRKSNIYIWYRGGNGHCYDFFILKD